MAAVLELADVTVRRGQATLLDGVDWTVEEDERWVILGPNGAGKTTLVLQCNGVLAPGAGRVTVAGLPVAPEHLKEIRRRVGIVFQDPDDQLFMPTVGEDVAFGPRNLGLPEDEVAARVAEALHQVGMSGFAGRPPRRIPFRCSTRVVLPAPFGPSRATRSPGSMRRSTPNSAWWPSG